MHVGPLDVRAGSPLVGYAVAIGSAALTIAVKVAADPWLGRDGPTLFLIIPVIAAAWLGGLGPGLAAAAIGALIANYFSGPYGLSLAPKALVLSVAFLLEGVAITWGAVALHAVRRRAEARTRDIARSENTTRAMLEAAAEGVVIVDREGRIARVNRRTEEMFGYGRDDLLGQSVEALVPARLAAAHAGDRAAYFTSPRTRAMGQGLQLFGRRRDGTEFPIEVGLSHLTTEEGPFAMALITDISERVNLERSARQAEKLAAVGTLAAGLAHEINNPIGIISTRIEAMLLEAGDTGFSAETREDLKVLHRNAMRVADITQRVLTLARSPSTKRVAVDMNAAVEEAVALLRKQLSKEGVDITAELVPGLPPVQGSPGALQQVVLNLVLNAAQSITDRGRVTIRTSGTVASGVEITVEDTGCGIPADKLETIFDPFYTTKPHGTGLGLSVSLNIIREHGGTIDVKSEPGRGTTFILRLPAASGSPTPS